MHYKDYWSRQLTARTKQQRIEQWQEYARLMQEHIKYTEGTLEECYTLVDIVSDLVVDVENGKDTTASVDEIVKWYNRREERRAA